MPDNKFNNLKLRIGYDIQNSIIYCRIIEQDIILYNNYVSPVSRSVLMLGAYPEFSSRNFYLRGANSSYNFSLITTTHNNFKNAFKTLCYAFDNKVKIEKDGDSLIIEFNSKFDINLSFEDIIKQLDTDINTLSNININKDFEKEKIKCNSCDESVIIKDISYDREISRNELYCKKCKLNMKKCDKCKYDYNEKLIKNHKSSIGGIYKLCENCDTKVRCKKCNKNELAFLVNTIHFINDNNYENEALKPVCRKCVIDMKQCNNCSCFYEKHCPCTIPKDFVGLIKVHNYDITHDYPFDSEIELFGIELECGVHLKHRELYIPIANKIKNTILGDAELKFDSSIDYLDRKLNIKNIYRGFEIVTRPLCYTNAILFLNKLTENKPESLKSWEVGTTGLHIHVSKDALSRIEIGKIVKFINDPDNKDFIKFISKREDKKFAKFIPKKKITNYNDNYHECHYEAFNTSKPHTVEFRMFRGTLNRSTLISYLQFVKSILQFVRTYPITQMKYNFYLEYLDSTYNSKFRELKNRINRSCDFNLIEEYEEI